MLPAILQMLMRQSSFLLTLVVGLICACNSTDTSQATSNSRLLLEPDIAQRLQYQKRLIDTMYIAKRDDIEILLKLSKSYDLIPFKGSILPDETEKSFYILRDSIKNILAITESPYSQSGDWFITLTHYFDKYGQTFAFERQTNFFNSGCTEGVAYETKTEFYNSDFQLINNEYKLVDETEKDLNKDSCTSMYELDYKVLPTLNKYLQTNRIKNGR